MRARCGTREKAAACPLMSSGRVCLFPPTWCCCLRRRQFLPPSPCLPAFLPRVRYLSPIASHFFDPETISSESESVLSLQECRIGVEEYDGGWGLATTVGIVLTYSRKGYGVVDRRLKSRASSPSSPCARLERSISPRKRTGKPLSAWRCHWRQDICEKTGIDPSFASTPLVG